jgi:hypothetical protein
MAEPKKDAWYEMARKVMRYSKAAFGNPARRRFAEKRAGECERKR